MKTSDFDYNLPEELIAHEPADKRDHSRLMVLDRQKESIQHKHFYNIVDYLNPGDLLVLNNTKVIPARLFGKKVGGEARVEVFLVTRHKAEGLRPEAKGVWKCLVKPGKRLKIGTEVVFGEGELVGRVVEKLETGEQIIEFSSTGDFWETIHKLGQVPLPPYIRTQITDYKLLSTAYQTVYADKAGASAAPTAGLHFTPELLEKIKAKGIKIAYVTLHTGLATFQPVRTDSIEEHKMHEEYFEVPEETITAIKDAKRVIAVGTTVVRTLESIAAKAQRREGETDLFIYPGYEFKLVDAIITNFHWPKSTLIMLVSAFAGRDFVMNAYQQAIQEKYRFFSFGDAMMII